VTVNSRPAQAHADTFPELAGLAQVLEDRRVLLNAEIVCIGDEGKPSFEWLATRLGNAKRARFRLDRVPAPWLPSTCSASTAPTLSTGLGSSVGPLVALDLDRNPGPGRVNPAYDQGADLFAVTGRIGLEGVTSPNTAAPLTGPGSGPGGG
jgi:hypothetical protein